MIIYHKSIYSYRQDDFIKRKYFRGVMVGGYLIQPPRCPYCGKYLYFPFNDIFDGAYRVTKCAHCGKVQGVYCFED